jgi:NADH pyrophosphatase NudC (nudix superfamily)
VYVWRKLKQLGSIALQDAAWVLPATPRTEEQLQWLASEITELGGDAVLWEAEQVYATENGALQRQFEEQTDAEYRDIVAALKKKNRDLAALSKRYLDAHARDYFGSKLGRKVRDTLLSAEGRKRP